MSKKLSSKSKGKLRTMVKGLRKGLGRREGKYDQLKAKLHELNVDIVTALSVEGLSPDEYTQSIYAVLTKHKMETGYVMSETSAT